MDKPTNDLLKEPVENLTQKIPDSNSARAETEILWPCHKTYV